MDSPPGLSAIAFGTFAIFAYIIGRVDTSDYLSMFYLPGAGELTVFCSAHGRRAASAFSGSTRTRRRSSWATPARSRSAARSAPWRFCSSRSSCSLIVGAVFVAETLSVILQRCVFKYRQAAPRAGVRPGAPRLPRAPLHHHFEMMGWTETQVVVRFWIIGILCAFVALSTLKLR